MNNVNKKSIIILPLLLILVSVFFLASCASSNSNGINQDQTNTRSQRFQGDNPGAFNRSNGRMTNLTDEERQKFIEERQAAEANACQSKNQGDECSLSMQNRTLSGTCETNQDKLLCTMQGFNRQNQNPN